MYMMDWGLYEIGTVLEPKVNHDMDTCAQQLSKLTAQQGDNARGSIHVFVQGGLQF